MSKLQQGLLGLSLLALLGYAQASQAETVFIKTKPSNTIKVGQAVKSKTPVAQCVKVKMGDSGRPKKVTGSSTLWLAEMPKADDSATDDLADGKAIYQCKSMEFDKEKGRMGKAVSED